jgi:soluble lytic murein transglycosylase-like protein
MANKAVLIAAMLAAAAFFLVRSQQQDDTGDDGEASPTAGDDASNMIDDGAATVMSAFSNWPVGSGPYRDMIQQAADDNGMPVSILAWQLWKESRFLPDVINGTRRSRVGAMGIAQFMPATAVEELGSTDAALDPAQAIPGMASYMAKLYRSTGSWQAALAAYNWGIGNVTRKGLAMAPAETTNYYTDIMDKAGVTA